MEKVRLWKRLAFRLHCRANTVCEVRKRFVEQGFAGALERKKRETPPTPRLFDGEGEAKLIALACSTPPEGRARWTLQLLADRVVELEIVPHCSANTVHEVLKKMNLSPIYANVGLSHRNRMLSL